MTLWTALRRHVNYANVAASLAVFIALSGTASAAVLITSAQIKDNTIRSRDIHNGTVTSRDIKNGTVHAADLASDAAGQRYVTIGTLVNNPDSATYRLNGFTLTLYCERGGTIASLQTSMSGSNFTTFGMSSFNGQIATGLFGRVNVTSADATAVGNDNDATRLELTGITPVQADGNRYGVFVDLHAIYRNDACTFGGVMMPTTP